MCYARCQLILRLKIFASWAKSGKELNTDYELIKYFSKNHLTKTFEHIELVEKPILKIDILLLVSLDNGFKHKRKTIIKYRVNYKDTESHFKTHVEGPSAECKGSVSIVNNL